MMSKTTPAQFDFGDSFKPRPTHRLFLGLWPDAATVQTLSRLGDDLRGRGMMRGRVVDADRFHLTLFHIQDFAGQIPPTLVPTLQDACATVAAAPFDIAFDRVRGTGKHCLLQSSGDLAALQAFRERLRAALAMAGVRPPDARRFSPHVTLSYDPCDLPETPVDPVGWRVTGFHLVESLLGQHRHIRRGSWTF